MTVELPALYGTLPLALAVPVGVDVMGVSEVRALVAEAEPVAEVEEEMVAACRSQYIFVAL